MKKTLGERIKFLVSDLGIQKQEFAGRIRFSQGYFSMVLSGAKPTPSERFFDAICREFNVNLEWLKNGKGDMYTAQGKPQNPEYVEMEYKYNLLPIKEQKLINKMIEYLLENSNPKK